MDVHGVDESEQVRLSNMPFLYDQVRQADKILSF